MLDAKGIESAMWIGLSMGGFLALRAGHLATIGIPNL